MRKFRKWISGLLAFVMALSAMVCNMAVTASAETPTLWVVGDSTGCHYADTADADRYYKRVGFGDKLVDYFNMQVENLALSGRSSKSFLNESNYQTLLSGMNSGDVLLIAFGHNDEKSDADLHTTPEQNIDKAGTFAYNLNENYIKKATAKGVKVVICSPIVRLPKDLAGDFSNSELHVTSEGSYVEAAKYTAAQTGSEFIDLTTLTKDKYKEVGFSEAVYYHSWNKDAALDPAKIDMSRVDTTHINNYGAKTIAYLIANAVKGNNDSVLKDYVKADAAAPVKETDLVKNDKYVEPDSSDPKTDTLDRTVFGVTEPWYATFFGASVKKDNVTIEEVDGGVHMAGINNCGKLAATAVGMSMYFQPFSAGENAQIHAVAHINSAPAEGQSSFGAIMTDTIKVNETNNSYDLSDFVVAGPFNNAYAGYAESSGAGTNGPKISNLDGIDEINVDIVAKDGKFAVKYGNAGQVFTSDKMTDMMYVGLYVARNVDVTFTDIECNGEIKEVDDLSTLLERKNFDCTITAKNSVDNGSVEGFTVKAADGSVVNAADGKYTLKDGDIYTISATGYVDKKILGIDRLANREIALTPSANITLNVTPPEAEYTVKDGSGNVISPVEENVYALTPGVEYTVSADGYKDSKFTASAEETTVEITLEKIDTSAVKSFTYWFDEQTPENLVKKTYYLAGGEVTLFDTFSKGGRKSYNGHTSYVGATNKASANGAEIGSGESTVPDAGNAYSFKPYADGTIKFYGGTDAEKNYNFLTVDDQGTATVKILDNSTIEEPYEVDAKKDYTYYMLGTKSTGNTQFVGFEYIVAKKLTVNGKIEKTDADAVGYPSQVTFTPKKGDAITVNVNSADGTFTVILDAGKVYDITTNSEELMITSAQTITAEESLETSGITINMTLAKDETVTGQLKGPEDCSAVTITFTKAGKGTPVTLSKDGSYSVALQPGTYSVEVTGLPAEYTLGDLSKKNYTVVQNGSNVRNFYSSKPAEAVTSKDVYVGVTGKEDDPNYFETIREAMAAINASSQSEYVVHLQGGKTYTEQVVVKANNVKFTTDGTGDATISWYYGFGYEYYSVNPKTGRYDEEYAFLKLEKDNPEQSISKWASTVIVEGNNFYAENVIFEATFNFKVTEEEKADGVYPAQEPYQTKVGEKPDRTTEGFDPQNKKATERAGAICIPSAKAEFYQCQFLSSQDTVVTNNASGLYYMNECVIVGETDYICGLGALVIDNSQLLWKGYSDAAPAPGYITAAQASKYLLRNCTIGGYTKGGLSFGAGYLGRHWADGATVIFADTTGINETNLIMSGSDQSASFNDPSGLTKTPAANANQYYCTTDAVYTDTYTEATKVNDQTGTVETQLTAEDVQGPTYLGSWRPVSYPFAEIEGADKIYDFDFTVAGADVSGKQTYDSTNKDASITLDATDGQIKYNSPDHGYQFTNGSAVEFTVESDSEEDVNVSVNFKISANSANVTVYDMADMSSSIAEYKDITASTNIEFTATPGKSYALKVSEGSLKPDFYAPTMTIITPAKIKACESAPTTTVKWDFVNHNTTLIDKEIGKNVTDGEIAVKGDPKWILKVVTDANGQMRERSSEGNNDAQVNSETTITVPVYAVGDKVTLDVNNFNKEYISFNGKTLDSTSTTVTATESDLAEGIKIKVSGGTGYINSITLVTTGTAPEPDVPEKPNSYDFKLVDAISETTLEGTVKDIVSTSSSTGKQGTLTVDTSEGDAAVRNAGSACQIFFDTAFGFTLEGEGELENTITFNTTYLSPGSQVYVKVYAADDTYNSIGQGTISSTGKLTATFNAEPGDYVAIISGSDFYADNINITTTGTLAYKAPSKTVTWQLNTQSNPKLPMTEVQGKAAGYASDTPGVSLYIDTKAGGAKFAPRANDPWSQFTEGTVIKVPVYAEGDTITVNAYSNTVFTVNDGEDQTANYTYNVTADDLAEGYVKITSKSDAQNGYISSIILTTTGELPTPVLTLRQLDWSDIVDGKTDVYVVAEISESAIKDVESIGIGVGKSEPGAMAEGNNVIDSEYTTTVFEKIVTANKEISNAEEGKYFAAIKVKDYDAVSGTLYAVPYTVVDGKAVYSDITDVAELVTEFSNE